MEAPRLATSASSSTGYVIARARRAFPLATTALLTKNVAIQLWGNPEHMRNIAKCLRDEHSRDELYLLLAKRNTGSFTYDGIERGGERVCAEIEEELRSIEAQGGKITKLSIIGYSLGGLVSRYTVGLLYAKGILDGMECMVSRGGGISYGVRVVG